MGSTVLVAGGYLGRSGPSLRAGPAILACQCVISRRETAAAVLALSSTPAASTSTASTASNECSTLLALKYNLVKTRGLRGVLIWMLNGCTHEEAPELWSGLEEAFGKRDGGAWVGGGVQSPSAAAGAGGRGIGAGGGTRAKPK